VFDALVNAFRAPDIRRRILFVLGMLVVVRALAHVPVPGVDRNALESVIGDNAFLQLLDLFSGGGLASFSIIALGVNPYINASIIMQLMTGVVPRLQQLQREGEYGRNKINQYTRYLTVPMGLLQAYGYLILLSSQTSDGVAVIPNFDLASLETLTMIASLVAGTILLMWIGELITERGIGNGISFIIFAGIVSRAPGAIGAFLAGGLEPMDAAGCGVAVHAAACLLAEERIGQAGVIARDIANLLPTAIQHLRDGKGR